MLIFDKFGYYLIYLLNSFLILYLKGIQGLEGLQAARASDYAIGEFRLLKRLLLIHGRESYRKNSTVILYNFYKNIVYLVPIFWFGVYSGFSGAFIYD